MLDSREFKIVFTGPMGAGKTTAIAAISDIPPVSTEVANNDLAAFDKEFTTVGLDYGQIALDDGAVVRLYGTPGQERFAFMRSILCQGAIGVVVLIDGSRPDAAANLDSYVGEIRRLAPPPAIVVGVGRCEPAQTPRLARSVTPPPHDEADFPVPVFSVDVRRRQDVLLLVETLVCVLEARAGGEGVQ